MVELCKIGLAWQGAAHSTDGVFDATFLPRGVWIAKVGCDVDVGEFVMCAWQFAVVVVCETGWRER